MENKGFSVYHEYWDAIKHFDPSVQGDIALATWKYCFEGEMPDPSVSPIAFGMISAWKMSLDNSIERFNNADVKGSKGGRPAKVDTEELAALVASGKKASEIAEILGVTVDTIYKRDEWKNRKKSDKLPVETPSKSVETKFDF